LNDFQSPTQKPYCKHPMLPKSNVKIVVRALVRWNSGAPVRTVPKIGQFPRAQSRPSQILGKKPFFKEGQNAPSKGKKPNQRMVKAASRPQEIRGNAKKRGKGGKTAESNREDVARTVPQRKTFSSPQRVVLQTFRPAISTDLQRNLDPTSPFFKGNLPLQPARLSPSLRHRMDSVDALREGPFAASISQNPKALSAVDIARHALTKNASMDTLQAARCLENVQQLTAVSQRQS